MNKINKIVIHCSATPNGREHTAEDIHRWHLERGFDGIGYHYVIRVDGTVESGRPEYWQGAHTSGYNDGSLGVCLVGTDSHSRVQMTALEYLVSDILSRIPDITDITGHNEISDKSCPGFNVKEWFSEAFQEVPF